MNAVDLHVSVEKNVKNMVSIKKPNFKRTEYKATCIEIKTHESTECLWGHT